MDRFGLLPRKPGHSIRGPASIASMSKSRCFTDAIGNQSEPAAADAGSAIGLRHANVLHGCTVFGTAEEASGLNSYACLFLVPLSPSAFASSLREGGRLEEDEGSPGRGTECEIWKFAGGQ